MVTIIALAFVCAYLGYAITHENDSGAIFGLIIGALLGLLIAYEIGGSFPTKTTVYSIEQMQILNVGPEGNNKFFVQEDQKNYTSTYQTDQMLKTVLTNETKFVFETINKPFIEYSKTVLNFPKGEGWKKAFGINPYGLPSEFATFHIPQGAVFVVVK